MLLRNAREVGVLIADGRRRLRWSQFELAQRAGVSRQWVSQVENGLIELSDLDIALICRTLGASPNAIFPLVEGQISEGSYAQAEI